MLDDCKVFTENGSEYIVNGGDNQNTILQVVHNGVSEFFVLLNIITCNVGVPAVFVVERAADSHIFNITTTRVVRIV